MDSPEPRHVGTFRLGRVYCEACRIIATVVRDADVVLVQCPHCGHPCVASGGADDLD